jgi:uncharacterized OB-fold protein
MTEYTNKPAPIPTAVSEPYWDAVKEGKLLLQYCPDCARYQFYPRPVCTACLGSDLEWREAQGTGAVYSFTVVHRAPSQEFQDTPYIVALVDLQEGVRMMSNIVGADPKAIHIGTSVKVRFEKRGDASVPVFELS